MRNGVSLDVEQCGGYLHITISRDALFYASADIRGFLGDLHRFVNSGTFRIVRECDTHYIVRCENCEVSPECLFFSVVRILNRTDRVTTGGAYDT